MKRKIDKFLILLEKQFDTVRIEVGGVDFSVWKIHLRAKYYPEVGDTSINYTDLNLAFKIIPLNTQAKPQALDSHPENS